MGPISKRTLTTYRSGLQSNTFTNLPAHLPYDNYNNTVTDVSDTCNTDTSSHINSATATNTWETSPRTYPDSDINASCQNLSSTSHETKTNKESNSTTDRNEQTPDKKKESGCGEGVTVKEEREHRPPRLMEPPIPNPPVTKRRRTVLSIAEKADLIRRLHNGESQRQLALEYGIGTSTVSDVKKHEVEILKYVETNGDFVAMSRRKLESGAKADVEEAVFDWVLTEVRRGQEVMGTEVMAKARQEHFRLRGNDEFRASTGWLERFKRRYNIRSFKPDEVDSWRPIISRVLQSEQLMVSRGRRRGRPPLTRLVDKVKIGERISNEHTLDFLEHVLEGSSPPSVKSEVENPDDYEYTETQPGEDLSPDTQSTLQPVVSLEEGQVALDIPPVQEIPSAGEAASFLSKALVWAAAQPDTTPQELYVMKQLQTKAAIRCIIHASH